MESSQAVTGPPDYSRTGGEVFTFYIRNKNSSHIIISFAANHHTINNLTSFLLAIIISSLSQLYKSHNEMCPS